MRCLLAHVCIKAWAGEHSLSRAYVACKCHHILVLSSGAPLLAALGVTLDTLICKAAHGESLLLREAVAKHPIIQQRYQTMVSAITAASAAAGVAREHRVRASRRPGTALTTRKLQDLGVMTTQTLLTLSLMLGCSEGHLDGWLPSLPVCTALRAQRASQPTMHHQHGFVLLYKLQHFAIRGPCFLLLAA